MAEFFGVSLDTIKEWSRNGMPGNAGTWPLNDIAQWKIKRASAQIQAGSRSQISEQRDKVALDRDLLKLRKEQGELVELADVERWSAEAISECRTRIMRLPNLIGTMLPTDNKRHEIVAEVDRQVRGTLEALTQKLESSDEISAEVGESV